MKESKLESCYHFFVDNCQGWEIKSRARSLKLLMSTLCQIHRSDLALHVFQEMEYQWCYPDRDTYKTLIKGLCVDGRLNEATHLLYSMFWRISQKGCGADVSVYRTLLESLCDNNQIDEAVELLEKVLRKGLKAPKKYLKQLDFSPFLKDEHDFGYVKALINEALIKGGIPSSDGYKAMTIDLYSEGKISEGNKMFEKMLKSGFRPSLPIYEAKVSALFAAGNVEEAVHVVEKEMIENNCVPTVRLHNVVINGLCKVRKINWAVKYFEKMFRQIGCVPNKETYFYLVDGLCLDGRYLEANRILEKMLINSYWPGDEMYTKLIRGLCVTGKTYRAVMLLEEMISQAKIPEVPVWFSLVTSVCDEPEVDILSVI